MNKPYKQSSNGRTDGFTIIEVVLVLAIAGLIFLMVFLALPALQRGQRDTQRKNDLSRINTQINNYQSSNRGAIPSASQMTASGTGFVARYLGGSGSVAGTDYLDPSSGNGYTVTTTTSNPAQDQINYQTNTLCGVDGAVTSTNANPRNYTLRVKLENQVSSYCLDNR
jgi:prepilin-type N-terminal cleavage/methylation domain-containing protein